MTRRVNETSIIKIDADLVSLQSTVGEWVRCLQFALEVSDGSSNLLHRDSIFLPQREEDVRFHKVRERELLLFGVCRGERATMPRSKEPPANDGVGGIQKTSNVNSLVQGGVEDVGLDLLRGILSERELSHHDARGGSHPKSSGGPHLRQADPPAASPSPDGGARRSPGSALEPLLLTRFSRRRVLSPLHLFHCTPHPDEDPMNPKASVRQDSSPQNAVRRAAWFAETPKRSSQSPRARQPAIPAVGSDPRPVPAVQGRVDCLLREGRRNVPWCRGNPADP